MQQFIYAFALIAAQQAISQENNFAACHTVEDEIERLQCYDRETGYKPSVALTSESPKQADTPVESTGAQWRYSEDTSALDDRKDVWLSVMSSNTEGNSIGSPIRATLWLRCMENKTNALIGFDRYTTDDQNVKFRLDDGPVQKQWMDTMRGGDGIGIWSGARAIPFIKKLLNHKTLVVGYRTYSGPVEFSFDIEGLENRVSVISKQCGWKL